MKIAFITDVIFPFSIGGSEIRNYEVARRLVKKGHEVHMFGIKYWEGNDILELEGIVLHGIWDNQKLYDKNGKRRALTSILLSFRLFRELLKERFDIIDTASFVFPNCYVTKVISLLKGNALVFTWHQYFGKYLFGYFGKGMGSIAFLLEYFSTGLADKNVAVSDYVQRKLVKRGVDRDNTITIESGADIKAIRSVPDEEKIYDMIFVGRLTYQKNLMMLIDTVELLERDCPRIKVCIVGDGDQRRKLIERVMAKGLQNCFDFVGKEDDRKKVYSLMKRSRIFIFTSILEGLPLTAVEANACGIPIVSVKTEWNDIEDFLKKGNKSGMTAPANALDLSKSILGLLRDGDKLNELGNNGFDKAAAYDWSEIAKRTERFYDRQIMLPKINTIIDAEYRKMKNNHLQIAQDTLRKTFSKFSRLGITSFYLWGSIARDDYRPNKSDIDIIAIVDDSFKTNCEKKITRFSRKLCGLKKFNINYVWASELKGGRRHSKMMLVFPPEIFLMNFAEWKLIAGHLFKREDFIPSNYRDVETIGFHRSRATKELISQLPLEEGRANFVVKACMRMCYFIHRTKHGDHPYSANTLLQYATSETCSIIPVLLSIRDASDEPRSIYKHVPAIMAFIDSVKVSYPNKHLYVFFNEVLPALEKKGIPYWVIGGTAIAGVAGTFIRENGDVDVCIPEDDFDKTKECLTELCRSHGESWKLIPSYDESLKRPIIEIFINETERFSVVALHATINGYELRLDENRIKIDNKPTREKRKIDDFTFFTFPTPILKKILCHTMELFIRVFPRQFINPDSHEARYWIDATILLTKKEQEEIYKKAKGALPTAFLIPLDRYIGLIGLNIKKISPKTYRFLKAIISH